MIDNCTVRTKDTKNGIFTEFRVDDKGISIDSFFENERLSEFGINLEMNFSGRKGTSFNKQLLPTSPYKSSDGRYMYYIMTNPEGEFLVVTALTECDGWKIDYSPECAGHYILNVKILSSFDRVYGGSGRKHLKINICAAQSID